MLIYSPTFQSLIFSFVFYRGTSHMSMSCSHVLFNVCFTLNSWSVVDPPCLNPARYSPNLFSTMGCLCLLRSRGEEGYVTAVFASQFVTFLVDRVYDSSPPVVWNGLLMPRQCSRTSVRNVKSHAQKPWLYDHLLLTCGIMLSPQNIQHWTWHWLQEVLIGSLRYLVPHIHLEFPHIARR